MEKKENLKDLKEKKRELSEKLYIEEKEMNGLKYFQFPDL